MTSVILDHVLSCADDGIATILIILMMPPTLMARPAHCSQFGLYLTDSVTEVKGKHFGAFEKSINLCECRTTKPTDVEGLPGAASDFELHAPPKADQSHMRNMLAKSPSPAEL